MPATAPAGVSPARMPAVALVLAHLDGADLEAALDAADTRAAAAALSFVLAQLIRLSGKDPASFFSDLRIAVIAGHLRRPPSGEVA